MVCGSGMAVRGPTLWQGGGGAAGGARAPPAPAGGEPVPDRRDGLRLGDRGLETDAVQGRCLGRVQEESVGEGLGEDRAEVVIEGCVAGGELVEERPVRALVVSDREQGTVGAQPAVHRTVVVLDPAALPAVIGIEVVAALIANL